MEIMAIRPRHFAMKDWEESAVMVRPGIGAIHLASVSSSALTFG